MAKAGLIREFLFFLRKEKKWWLIPLAGLAIITALALAVGSHPTAAAFLYPAQ